MEDPRCCAGKGYWKPVFEICAALMAGAFLGMIVVGLFRIF